VANPLFYPQGLLMVVDEKSMISIACGLAISLLGLLC
jgi:hypothetical protein